ncbi:hypothetical protein [Streptomyces achromogenes]|uniref:hypothetical protein n=1 Tax=Streptomyces achromogenes TaxID=67255 RepID=UPI0036C93370
MRPFALPRGDEGRPVGGGSPDLFFEALGGGDRGQRRQAVGQAISAPARSEPVKETPRTRESAMARPICSWVA